MKTGRGILVSETPRDAIACIEAQLAVPKVAFSLSEAETTKIAFWRDVHDNTHAGDGAIGGRYTYSFTPTTLGVVVVVACACGGSVDVTNYEEW